MIPMKKTSTTKPKKMGRPTKDPNEKKSFLYAVKITPREYKAVMQCSKKQDQTPAEWFRSIISTHLDQHTLT
jgi:hypothetical protein